MKTFTTLSDDDENPIWSLCPGHVDAEVFQEALTAEGWDGDPPIAEHLTHEWWGEKSDGSWVPAEETTPGAKAVTVMEWV